MEGEPYEDNCSPRTCKCDSWLHLAIAHVAPQVMDVAQALVNAFELPSVPSVLAFPGPSRLTHEYLLALVSSLTYHPPSRAPIVPKRLALLVTQLSNRYIWWPTLSPDEIERRYINDVDVPGDWDKVGVEPTEIEENAITYLRRYRSAYVPSPITPSCLFILGANTARTTSAQWSCHPLARLR